MTTSEPTTGEIVRALRCSADDDSFCKKCQYGYALAHAFLCDRGRMNGNAADRLESQEATISALTARAEQAELARDILCGTIRDMEEPKTVGSSTFTIERRGLQPQEGWKA